MIAVRCPWCTARTTEGEPCAACGCERVDASDYGVARMLRTAGVDRISLPERARTLDLATRARLASDWRAQKELADALRADAAPLLGALPAGARLLEQVDDELARRIPVAPIDVASLRWPERPGSGDSSALLEALRATHPVRLIRQLAALAQLARGDHRRDVVDAVVSLAQDATVAGATAAALLYGWRARASGVTPRKSGEHLEKALAAGLAIPELAPWAAVAIALGDVGVSSAHDALLRAVDSRAPLELQLGAALALKDETRLAAFVDDADEQRRGEARRALAALGSAHLVSLLAPAEDQPLPPDHERRALLRDLPEPLPRELRAAVMRCVEQGGEELASQALRVLMRGCYRDRDDDDRAALGAFAMRNAARLGAEQALGLLAWVTADQDADAAGARPFVVAARDALSATPMATRPGLRGLERFLVHATDDDLAVLDALFDASLAAVELGARLLGRALDLHARRDDHHLPATWMARLCQRWWSRAAPPVECWAQALRSRSGMSGRDEVIGFFWRRFCEVPAERTAIVTATRGWSHLLREVREATPVAERPGGDDAVAVWEIWSAAEPTEMWRLVDELNPNVPEPRLAEFAQRVFDAAERIVAERPRIAIVTVFRVCAEIANRVRREQASEALDTAAAVIERRVPPFAVRFGAARACEDSERGAEHFLEDIATERRLIGEVYQHRREAAERDAEREAERIRRLQLAEAARVTATEPPIAPPPIAPPPIAPPPTTVRLPQPAFERGGLDDEPFLPGPGPRSVVEYAQLIKALQRGSDALAVFAAYGLDAVSWAACANRWAELMMRRTDIALRFAALLSAPWE